jgi:AcrR family transcriptional regulator
MTEEKATGERQTSLRERQRHDREELILAEAERMISASGFDNLSLDALAEHVGIAKGTIYLHFKTKEELLAAVLSRGADGMIAAFEAIAAEQGMTSTARLQLIIEKAVKGHAVVIEFAQSSGVLKLRDIMMEHGQFETRAARLAACLQSIVQSGQQSGELDPALDPRMAVLALFGTVRAIAHASRAITGPVDRDEAQRGMVHLLFHGLLHREPDNG